VTVLELKIKTSKNGNYTTSREKKVFDRVVCKRWRSKQQFQENDCCPTRYKDPCAKKTDRKIPKMTISITKSFFIN